jgi:PhnB protein
MLSYEDAGAAADWLCAAFGFTELDRVVDSERATHVTLAIGEGVVMAGWPGPEYRSPARHRATCAEARAWLESVFVVDGVYVRVDDIDGHFERARSTGAIILSGLEDNAAVGQRQYRAEDVEGHRWMFAEPLSAVG